MPRQSRVKAVERTAPAAAEVIIPTNALVASAARFTSRRGARIYQRRQDWQRECYRHYAICGEARFAARLMGRALSRATLEIAKPKPGTHEHTHVHEGPAVELLDKLFAGKHGQAQMLESIGIHLTIAGDCYLIGREVNGEDVWEVVSVLEVDVVGETWTIRYGDDIPPVPLTDNDVVIRIWNPSPDKRMEADSPFRSLLPILSEIEWLTRHIFAQTSSRLAGAGLLLLPTGTTFPPPPSKEGKQTAAAANEATAFMITLADAMLEPIKNPDSPESIVPVVAIVPPESVDKVKLIHFWSNLDKASMDLRQEAIRRFALGMDMPPEQIMGMSSNPGTGGGTSNGVSHWGAWQIEESTIKLFVEPMLGLVCNALTVSYLRPLLEDDSAVLDGIENYAELTPPSKIDEFVIADTQKLRLRPDRSKEALELNDRGILKDEIAAHENGFGSDDLMNENDRKAWLLRKVASGSATPEMVNAALELMGVDLGLTPAELGENNRESRPAPSLEEHPPPKAMPEAAALLAASDALVFRALERAGNRIRQDAGIKPPGVPAFKIHTMHAVNGSADRYLHDAWSCAPQVLEGAGVTDVEKVIGTLDAYCRSLFAEQAEHNRERLAKWLEAAS